MIDCYSRKATSNSRIRYIRSRIYSGTYCSQCNKPKIYVQVSDTLECQSTDLHIMFGDNKSMITNGSVPHSKLGKRHLALAYHKVSQAVASGMVVLTHIDGELNIADIPSKHWSYQKIWPLLRPLLFWHGDTAHVTKTKEPD